MYNPENNNKDKEYIDTVVQVKRVSKKTKGGNQVSFTALVVSGNKNGKVGVGLGKAKSVADAITKASRRAKKDMQIIPIVDGTINKQINIKYKSARVMLRPGKKGAGLIAGGPVRVVVELAGIKDIASKVIGSKNKSVNVWATYKALSLL